jgi:Lrp/AsnC family leucine-responsive transcriptional regulator
VIADDAVQQCWRVSPGPDFVLVVAARDMPDYRRAGAAPVHADANVRNVKAFFSGEAREVRAQGCRC